MAAGTPQTLPSGRDVLGIAREVMGTVGIVQAPPASGGTPAGYGSVPVALTVSLPGDDIRALVTAIHDLREEVRLLRLGLICAPDSVCVDVESELVGAGEEA